MKHSLLYIFILAIMTGLLSCSKSLEQDGGLVSDMPLVFSPTADWPQMGNGDLSGSGTRSGNGTGTGAATKALVESAEDLKRYGISLFATATKGEDRYPVFNNDNLYFNNSNGSWDYGSTKYWIPGANYSFAAFAPYATPDGTTGEGVKLSNGTVTVSAEPTEPSIKIENYITGMGDGFDARNEDLLYAVYSRKNTDASYYSAVPLQFDHLLSCITFYIRNATGNDIARIDRIKLGGLEYKCTIEVSPNIAIDNIELGQSEDSSPYFTGYDRPLTGETMPFLPKGMNEGEAKPLFDCTYLTVLPQKTFGKNYSGNDINITLSFRVHNTLGTAVKEYTGNLSKINDITKWEPGKKYRYNITISSQDIIFQVQEIPWIKDKEVEL